MSAKFCFLFAWNCSGAVFLVSATVRGARVVFSINKLSEILFSSETFPCGYSFSFIGILKLQVSRFPRDWPARGECTGVHEWMSEQVTVIGEQRATTSRRLLPSATLIDW